jgi:hypothetical protein
MAKTTFSGPVRSINGFHTITRSGGVDTVVASMGGSAAPPALDPGSGTAGTGTIVGRSVTRTGNIIETKIVIDLTGLNGGGTAADIIGVDGAANCHFGQITTAVNGVIYAGKMTCLEVPTGSNADVDLYAASVGTGVEDAAVTSLSGQAILVNGGTWTLALTAALTAYPAANAYLYLASGTATAATFTAGIFEIILYGTVA